MSVDWGGGGGLRVEHTEGSQMQHGTAAERPQLVESLHDIASTVLSAELPAYDPWLYRYCGELAGIEDTERYLQYQLDHLRLAGVELSGKDVLDVGCGFGFTLVTCGLLGATTLRGIDNYPSMVETVNAYLPLLPTPLQVRLAVDEGSASDMPYEDASFDVLLSYEAISHYLDVEGFLNEAARVLRPGGRLVISDGNNGLNPLIRRRTRQIWRAFETGTATDVVHGHEVRESYVDKRRKIIRDSQPGLSDAEVHTLADETSRMVADDVRAAARRYVENGKTPGARFNPSRVPVNPNGQVIERLFNPYRLGRAIGARGFSTRVYGYWGGASGQRALRLANDVLARLSPLTIFSARGFRLVAVKDRMMGR